MKRILILSALFSCIHVWGQSSYSKIQLPIYNSQTITHLIEKGIHIDHFLPVNDGKAIELILSFEEREILDQLQYKYDVVIEDMDRYHQQTLGSGATTIAARSTCDLQFFQTGSMAAHLTFSEMEAQLDSMHAHFPNLISGKVPIGQSVEGRPIWAVKISDHPDKNESASEGVAYVDALTHAREPLSMTATLYFMWWLLENYGTHDLATYLVDEREMYFVPVVNPDGYVYNEQTHPGGGGLWRKNRRINSNGCVGIDLNRNFALGWGLNIGSTNDPCSNTFRGGAAFSEPEAHAVGDFLKEIKPVIAYSIHSFGNKFLNPLGYIDSVVNYEVYSELALDCMPKSFFGYGTVKEMLNYNSAGTTRDYFHSRNIYGWTVELGSTFWEAPDNLCFRVQEALPAFVQMVWLAGAKVDIHQVRMSPAIPGDTLQLNIRVKNKGLSLAAQQVFVRAQALSTDLQAILDSTSVSGIPPRRLSGNALTPLRFVVDPQAQFFQPIPIELVVEHNGIISDRDTVHVLPGIQRVLFSEDFEQGRNFWYSPAQPIAWDTSFVGQVSGNYAMADSRYGNYRAQSNTYLQLMRSIDLQGANTPILEFSAKWSLESSGDYVWIELQENNGSWIPLEGNYTQMLQNKAVYTGHQDWVQERIDLSPFIGQKIRLRFLLQSNNLVHSDGFYFDDFRVVDYRQQPTTSIVPEISGLRSVQVFPNPTEAICNLSLTVEQAMELEVTWIDMLGKVVLPTKKHLFVTGYHQISMDISSLQPGIYTLNIRNESSKLSQKVILK